MISNEQELILLLSKDKSEILENDLYKIKNLLRGNLDWDNIFTCSLNHKVAFIFFYNLKKLNLIDFTLENGNLSLLLLNHWRQLYNINNLRNNKYFEALEEINRSFEFHSIDYAVAKGGPLLIGSIYHMSERKMYDLDLIARKKDIERIHACLKEIDFDLLDYSHDRNEYSKIDEKITKKWILLGRGMPNYVKITNDITEKILLQVQFKVGSTELNEYVGTDKLLDQRVKKDDFYSISIVDLFIQLSLHIYRETNEMAFKNWGMDWNLIKFCDLERFCNKYLEQMMNESTINRLKELNVLNAVLYSLSLTQEIYPTELKKKAILYFNNNSLYESLYSQEDVINNLFGLKKINEKSEWDKIIGSKKI